MDLFREELLHKFEKAGYFLLASLPVLRGECVDRQVRDPFILAPCTQVHKGIHSFFMSAHNRRKHMLTRPTPVPIHYDTEVSHSVLSHGYLLSKSAKKLSSALLYFAVSKYQDIACVAPSTRQILFGAAHA